MNYRLYDIEDLVLVGRIFEVKWKDLNRLKTWIKETDQALKAKQNALGILNFNVRIGITQHIIPEGFMYFTGYRVKSASDVAGYDYLTFPKNRLLVSKTITLHSIQKTYLSLAEWIDDSSYVPFKASGTSYYDTLPIKIEWYYKQKGTVKVGIPIVLK